MEFCIDLLQENSKTCANAAANLVACLQDHYIPQISENAFLLDLAWKRLVPGTARGG